MDFDDKDNYKREVTIYEDSEGVIISISGSDLSRFNLNSDVQLALRAKGGFYKLSDEVQNLLIDKDAELKKKYKESITEIIEAYTTIMQSTMIKYTEEYKSEMDKIKSAQ